MNIGFYGHSTCSQVNTPNNESFIDQIKVNLNATIVNVGVPQGSEERILFDLKKTKKLDYAVIFHSYPKFIFLPRCHRDISISTVPSKKAQYFWSEKDDQPIDKESFENIFFSYGGIKEVFETAEAYVDAVTTYKEFFYHPDLLINRYQATLMLIDSYLYNQNIPSLHIINPKSKPSWFKFQSGQEANYLSMLPYVRFYNNISLVHNNLIANVVQNWVESFKQNG